MVEGSNNLIGLVQIGESGIMGVIGFVVVLSLLYLFDEPIDKFLKKWNIT